MAAIGQQFAGNQINQLAADIRSVTTLIQQIRVSAELVATNLAPGRYPGLLTRSTTLISTLAALDAVNGELAAVQRVLQPFITPLEQLATAVRNANASAIFRVEGLRQAVTGLVGIVSGIVNRLLALLGQK